MAVGNANKSLGDKVLLPLIYPFGALILSLKNWRQPWAMNMFWVVCMYLGAIQIFCPEGTILGTGTDGGRYVLSLQEMYQCSSIDIAFNKMFTDWTIDIYQPLLTILLSIFTDNGHVLFFCFAAVFGFFY